ncbi:hypothetical protein CDD83_10528 [Cordyceps sp. RAO-2017]|nr:hypothetical protein CDD83_10528 [Cordyceps sp. RAO-2017]
MVYLAVQPGRGNIGRSTDEAPTGGRRERGATACSLPDKDGRPETGRAREASRRRVELQAELPERGKGNYLPTYPGALAGRAWCLATYEAGIRGTGDSYPSSGRVPWGCAPTSLHMNDIVMRGLWHQALSSTLPWEVYVLEAGTWYLAQYSIHDYQFGSRATSRRVAAEGRRGRRAPSRASSSDGRSDEAMSEDAGPPSLSASLLRLHTSWRVAAWSGRLSLPPSAPRALSPSPSLSIVLSALSRTCPAASLPTRAASRAEQAFGGHSDGLTKAAHRLRHTRGPVRPRLWSATSTP